MITEEMLKEFFAEFEDISFDEWAAEYGYTPEWSDKQIYDALPDFMREFFGDIWINYSWYHDGM